MIDGWRYYNHALISTCEPHEECYLPKKKIDFGEIGGGTRYLLVGLLNLIVEKRLVGGM